MQTAKSKKKRERIAPVNVNTVGVHRTVGRDDIGRNIEVKVCPLQSEQFVDRDGNICDHPMQNSRIPTEDGRRDGERLRRELIQEGLLPLGECPHTEAYSRQVGGPLVAVPEGEKACQGEPAGCKHMKAVIAKRTAVQKDAASSRQLTPPDPNSAGIQQLGSMFGAALGEAVRDLRGNLRDGQDEDVKRGGRGARG